MRSLSFVVAMALSLPTHAEPLVKPGIDVSAFSWLPPLIDRPSPIIDLFSAPPPSFVAVSAGGARLSVAPIGGHEPGDTIRTQFDVETTSAADAAIEETSSLFEMKAVTGYASPWFAGVRYVIGEQIKGRDGSIFAAERACRSGEGPAPIASITGRVPSRSDGGCSWHYVGIGAGSSRSAQLLTTSVHGPNGGEAWGQSIMVGVKTGAWSRGGGFAVGQEVDVGNENRDCPPAVPNGCQIYGSFINGNGMHRSTLGVFIGGQVGFHVALQFASTAASDTTIADASRSKTGFYQNGEHDMSYVDRSRALKAISLEGKYGIAQIAGAGWSVGPTGSLSAHAIREPISAPPSSATAPCQAGDHAWDANYEYRCVALNTWKRAQLSTW